jgi:hypothetical protein
MWRETPTRPLESSLRFWSLSLPEANFSVEGSGDTDVSAEGMGLGRMSDTEWVFDNSHQYLGTLRDEAVDNRDAWYKEEEAICAYWCGVVVALEKVLGHLWPDIPPE